MPLLSPYSNEYGLFCFIWFCVAGTVRQATEWESNLPVGRQGRFYLPIGRATFKPVFERVQVFLFYMVLRYWY
jgi:hypothetical protein